MNRFQTVLLFSVFLVFIGCQKSAEVTAPESVSKLAPSEIRLSLPETICAGKEFSINMIYRHNITGKMDIRVSSDKGRTWKTAAETYSGTRNSEEFYLSLNEGNYLIQGCFVSSGKEIRKSEILERNVFNYSDCEGLVLEPDLEGKNYIVHSGTRKTFTVKYTILNCDKDYMDLVLTGKLNEHALFRSSSPLNLIPLDETHKNFLKWNIGDVKAGYQKTFEVTFDLDLPTAAYGSLVPLTGAFVLKGKNHDGSDVTVGDYNEIFVQVQ